MLSSYECCCVNLEACRIILAQTRRVTDERKKNPDKSGSSKQQPKIKQVLFRNWLFRYDVYLWIVISGKLVQTKKSIFQTSFCKTCVDRKRELQDLRRPSGETENRTSTSFHSNYKHLLQLNCSRSRAKQVLMWTQTTESSEDGAKAEFIDPEPMKPPTAEHTSHPEMSPNKAWTSHTCSPPRPHVQTTERVTGPTQWNVRGMKKLKIKITDLFFNETETNILF